MSETATIKAMFGDELRVGDTFKMVGGNPREFRVVALRPYTGPLLADLGEGTQVATVWSNGSKFEISCPAVSRYLVERAA